MGLGGWLWVVGTPGSWALPAPPNPKLREVPGGGQVFGGMSLSFWAGRVVVWLQEEQVGCGGLHRCGLAL